MLVIMICIDHWRLASPSPRKSTQAVPCPARVLVGSRPDAVDVRMAHFGELLLFVLRFYVFDYLDLFF